MTQDFSLPKIATALDLSGENGSNSLYVENISKVLKCILPPDFFELYRNEPENKEALLRCFCAQLPFFHTIIGKQVPGNLSFYILSKYRQSSFKFCFEMISRWLVPGKRLNVLLIYAVDFSMPELGDDLYTICEIVLKVESKEELEEIQRHLPIIETETRLGVGSSYYARRILEIKGLLSDEKTAMIQEHIAYMIGRLPKEFSYDVITEMQHVLVMCRDEFKAARDVRHLSRIICVQYLFRKTLRELVKQAPEKRHLVLKIFTASLRNPLGMKKVLGVIVGVNFLRDKEFFEETHIVKAIQNYIPMAEGVSNSFFFNRRGMESIGTIYLEIEKRDGSEFTGEEIKLLRKELPQDLEGRVEGLMPSVFMPRNEEEIMRTILTLSNQIKYPRDIPQISITFDEQTHDCLFFTVILARAIKKEAPSLQEMFRHSGSFMEYIHDQSKVVGLIRKKYEKEATVFQLKVPKEEFLRRDHSIDLYKARQAVVIEISRVVGEVRDYNGGMISKQSELLEKVKRTLAGSVKYNDDWLENFFYSIQPVIMRTVLEPEATKKLFLMLLETLYEKEGNEESYTIDIRAEPNFVYVLITSEDRKVEEQIKQKLNAMHSSSLVTAYVQIYETHYLGYIYRSDDPLKQRQFCVSVQHAIEACQHKRHHVLNTSTSAGK